jgi:hypothetical protein
MHAVFAVGVEFAFQRRDWLNASASRTPPGAALNRSVTVRVVCCG